MFKILYWKEEDTVSVWIIELYFFKLGNIFYSSWCLTVSKERLLNGYISCILFLE